MIRFFLPLLFAGCAGTDPTIVATPVLHVVEVACSELETSDDGQPAYTIDEDATQIQVLDCATESGLKTCAPDPTWRQDASHGQLIGLTCEPSDYLDNPQTAVQLSWWTAD